MILLNLLILLIVPLVSGSIDSFEDKFIDPSIEEQKMFKNLLEQFLKLDIDKKDVSGILNTFEKPRIVTFPCNIEDVNDLVVNVVETRLAGFTVPEEHEGGVIVGGISSSQEWRNDVCNKTPTDKIDYSYSDKQHIVINPLQEEFASQLVSKEGGVFFLEKINPIETENGEFFKKITSRFDHPQLVDSGIKVTYRGINTNELSVSFHQEDIVISGSLKDKTKSGTVWLYAFPEDNPKTNSNQEIPQWIKNNAAWWSEETITDSDFLNGI